MANHDPQKTQPDPQPAPSGQLVPVHSFNFPAGVKLGLPGKKGVWNGLTATKPTTSEYWSIAWDRAMRHHVVAHFKAGPDMKRAPSDTLNIPEAMVTWRRA